MLKIFYILLNLLAFPGLGTFCSGRKKAGICQLCLAASGFALSLWGAGILILRILHSGLTPMEISDAIANETLMPWSQLLFFLGWAVFGMVLFGIAWTWAALTPQDRRMPPPLP